jgi:hypothetical protein
VKALTVNVAVTVLEVNEPPFWPRIFNVMVLVPAVR